VSAAVPNARATRANDSGVGTHAPKMLAVVSLESGARRILALTNGSVVPSLLMIS
jgi:hypothetical protein